MAIPTRNHGVAARRLSKYTPAAMVVLNDAIAAGELEHLGHHWAEFRGVMLRE